MIRHQISDWLYVQISHIWNPENAMQRIINEEWGRVREDVQLGSDAYETMRESNRSSFSREQMIEYWMGDMTNSQSSLKWANFYGTSKTKAISYYLDELALESDNAEWLIRNITYSRNILAANNRDEIKLAFIKNYYDYWNNLDDDQLFSI